MVAPHARVFSGLRLPGWTTARQPCTVRGQAVPEEPLGGFCMPSVELGQWQGEPAIGHWLLGKQSAALEQGGSCSLSKNLSVHLMQLKIASVKDAFFLPTVKKVWLNINN